MTSKVNGKPVKNLNIKKLPNGEYEITYNNTFNLIHNNHQTITRRLHKHHLKAQIYKNLKYQYITIFYYEFEKVHQILAVLNVPLGCYEIIKEDKIINIYLTTDLEYDTDFYKRR